MSTLNSSKPPRLSNFGSSFGIPGMGNSPGIFIGGITLGIVPGIPFGIVPGIPFGIVPGIPFGIAPGIPSGIVPGIVPGIPSGIAPGIPSGTTDWGFLRPIAFFASAASATRLSCIFFRFLLSAFSFCRSIKFI